MYDLNPVHAEYPNLITPDVYPLGNFLCCFIHLKMKRTEGAATDSFIESTAKFSMTMILRCPTALPSDVSYVCEKHPTLSGHRFSQSYMQKVYSGQFIEEC